MIVGEWFGNSFEAPVDRMKQKAAELGAPLFVGEFGAPAPGVTAPLYMAEYYLMTGSGPLAMNQLRMALESPDVNSVDRARIEARLTQVRDLMPPDQRRRQERSEPEPASPASP